jgi:hypothetical protein
MAYYLLPRCLANKRYAVLIAGFILFSFGIILLNVFVDGLFSGGTALPSSPLANWGTFWGYGGYGAPFICGIFLVARGIKYYDRILKEKEELIKANTESELQLLTAQVHPHFLFNTLNCIYSFALRRSPVAADLVGSLERTLRYMINSSTVESVPLSREIGMLEDYVRLERMRYGDRLSISMEVTGECDGKKIDPLLLIPLIENCFKHGVGAALEEAWIKMRIFIEDAFIRAEFSNSQSLPSVESERKGIGLKNVRKRLELLYPGQHSLEVSRPPGAFRVFIRFPLNQKIANRFSYGKEDHLSACR